MQLSGPNRFLKPIFTGPYFSPGGQCMGHMHGCMAHNTTSKYSMVHAM